MAITDCEYRDYYMNKGDRVKVIDGPYYGIIGTIQHHDGSTYSLRNNLRVNAYLVIVDGIRYRFGEDILQREGDYLQQAQCNQPKNNNKVTMEKFYRTTQPTYMFEKGAILSSKDGSSYKAVDDIWHLEGTTDFKKFMQTNPGINPEIVENSPDWFERVYSVKSLQGMFFVVKDKMKDMMSKGTVDKDGSTGQEETPA